MQAPIAARPHHAVHYVNRVGWLRAAVLGANDGIVSTASLMTGIAASGASAQAILLSGVAALVAGAMSMAAGEYVSVSAQADTERADLAKEAKALRTQPHAEWVELRDIYVERGLTPDLAGQVAQQLMAADALGAHVALAYGIVTILVVTPMLGFAIVQIPFEPVQFRYGLALFACVPTTLTSGVTLVTSAAGNGALALMLTVTTNVLGVFTVPFISCVLLAIIIRICP